MALLILNTNTIQHKITQYNKRSIFAMKSINLDSIFLHNLRYNFKIEICKAMSRNIVQQ